MQIFDPHKRKVADGVATPRNRVEWCHKCAAGKSRFNLISSRIVEIFLKLIFRRGLRGRDLTNLGVVVSAR
jgi:hypothetical protein